MLANVSQANQKHREIDECLPQAVAFDALVLFGGDQGPEVLEKGCSAPCVLRTCAPASLFEGLRPILEARVPAALRPAP